MAGETRSFGAAPGDFYLVKTNSQGDTLWTRTYGGSNRDGANSVQQTADGGYIVAGFTYSFGAGTPNYYNIYLVKTNAQGDTLWTRTYGGSNDDLAMSVQQTTDGGYILAGQTASFGAGGWDFYLVKTGPDCANLSQTPAAPEVVITIEGSDARLNWDSVTVSIYGCPIDVTHYLVFFSEEYEGPYWYHGYTADTTYLHVGAAFYASGMFYNVTATTAPLPLLQSLPTDASLKRDEVLRLLKQ